MKKKNGIKAFLSTGLGKATVGVLAVALIVCALLPVLSGDDADPKEKTQTTQEDNAGGHTIPEGPVIRSNQVDLRNYITVEYNNLKVDLRQAMRDFEEYAVPTVPADHPYYSFWDEVSNPQVDSTIVLIAREYKAIKLVLVVPDGRDWYTEGGAIHSPGMNLMGTFTPGDELRFTWEVDEQVVANLESLLGVEFVWEDYIYTVPDTN